jgi:hypothetical protein
VRIGSTEIAALPNVAFIGAVQAKKVTIAYLNDSAEPKTFGDPLCKANSLSNSYHQVSVGTCSIWDYGLYVSEY